ncbi:MAG TPA: PIN domain-containing protein [Actinomycetota bacterium]
MALSERVRGHRLVSSTLGRLEALRVARRLGLEPGEVERILSRIHLRRLDTAVLTSAASLEPPTLGTLDAIHLATALPLAAELEALVTYDRQLGRAATAAGLTVEAPR